MEWVDAVRAFNQRIAASRQQLPETPRPTWMPGMEVYLATEGSAVRGGYILRHQKFFFGGQELAVAHYRLPLSEGVVDRNYAMLGVRLVRDALARQPRLYCLGMGGWTKPLPQMLKSLKWRMCEVPFHFKVLRPTRFLHNIRVVRTSIWRKIALDAAALTGAGWLGMKIIGHGARVAPQSHDMLAAFDGWADAVWKRSRDAYTVIAERNADTLEALYPAGEQKFLRVRAGDGWAVALDTQMRGHLQFGDMRVGSIVDCLAAPDQAASVICAAVSVLEERGVDLIVSNQLHRSWSEALQQSGFRKGPSNFLLALSPALASSVMAPDGEIHFNRGDGDGPIHL
jgi:hypothetical protein